MGLPFLNSLRGAHALQVQPSGRLAQTPPGWNPSPDWSPDPSWPPPPEGWNLWIWVEDRPETHGNQIPPANAIQHSADQKSEKQNKERSKKVSAIFGTLLVIASLVVSYFAWVYPDPANQVSTVEERQPYIAQVESLCDKAAEASQAMTARELDVEQTTTRLRAVHSEFATLLLDWSHLDLPARPTRNWFVQSWILWRLWSCPLGDWKNTCTLVTPHQFPMSLSDCGNTAGNSVNSPGPMAWSAVQN